MEYSKEDIVRIDWNQFEIYMNKIKNDILGYLEENNLNLDVIVPILRGGGIPALYLANQLRVIRVLPYQFKYLNNEKKEIKILDVNFTNLYNFSNDSPVVLVVEGNHSTGNLAGKVVKDIKNQLPNSKILYVTLAKDYFYRNSVQEVKFTTCGFYTNENRKLSQEECKNINIEFEKVYIFPWELEEEEFAALNYNDFEYRNNL